jgi:hypothetical protein
MSGDHIGGGTMHRAPTKKWIDLKLGKWLIFQKK